MAVIAGTTIQRHLSPRIVTIPVAETSITVDDLQDTLQDIEDDVLSMPWPKLRDTSGGQDLGGGTSVGLTMQLQNTQIAFAARTTNVETGTVTTANAAGDTLIDSTALFVTNGVLPGATIVNFTDQSVATVISVDSEIQLTHYTLDDGTDDDWDSADVYKVWNEIQTEIAGGNTVAVDAVGDTISAIFPTFGTQVLKTSSSSATQSDLDAIQYASYGGGVWVDVTGTQAGTAYPTGNGEFPVNNFTDAELIAVTKGFRKFFVKESATITGADLDFSDGHKFVGFSPVTVAVTVDTSANLLNCEFIDMQIAGTLDGNSVFRECIVGTVNYINGFIYNCTLGGIITLGGGANASIEGCWQQQGGTVPEIDMGGSGQQLSLSDFKGEILLSNCTGAGNTYVSGTGKVTLDATITSGTFTLYGDLEYEDNTTGSAVVIDKTSAALTWEHNIEGTYTAEEVMRIVSSALAGKVTGGPNSPVFRDISDTKNRITATTDANGNRSVVTLDET